MASNKKGSFTFVHAADLHLDSPFKGTTANNPAIADALRSATFRAYHSLIGLCVERKAAFLLIAGDVYDAEDRSLRAQLGFRDGLVRRQKRISRFSLPTETMTLITVGPQESNGRRTYTPSTAIRWNRRKWRWRARPLRSYRGTSHARKNETNNLAIKFKRGEGELFQVGLLHCNVGLNTGHDPYAPASLRPSRSGFDYWALGHVHQKQCLTTDPYVVYSGVPRAAISVNVAKEDATW